LFGDSQSLFHLRAKRFRVGDGLSVVAQAHDGGKHLLETESEIPATPVERRT
jgi:hypothetical protein